MLHEQQKGTPGWRGGTVGRSACHWASQPESDAWDPHDEGENARLQAVHLHMCAEAHELWYACMHTHIRTQTYLEDLLNIPYDLKNKELIILEVFVV